MPAAMDSTQLSNPPTMISNNNPTFKYKYPQASPTPPGVDDIEWNKLFTAADSRFYNKAHKSAVASKAKRESGETYTLALQMLQEKREKASSAPKAKIPPTKKPQPLKDGPTGSSREATPTAMDMAERIKTEGRPRKAASVAPSEHGTPAPSPIPKAEPSKPHKPGPKKGTAAPTKKQQHKKSLAKSKIGGMSFGLFSYNCPSQLYFDHY